MVCEGDHSATLGSTRSTHAGTGNRYGRYSLCLTDVNVFYSVKILIDNPRSNNSYLQFLSFYTIINHIRIKFTKRLHFNDLNSNFLIVFSKQTDKTK